MKKILFLCLGIGIVLYLIYFWINAIIYYRLSEKAKLNCKWLAYVPFAQSLLFFKLIRKNPINSILLFIPFVNIIFYILWEIEFLEAFDIDSRWVFVNLIPIFGIIIYLALHYYMAYSPNVRYVNFPPKKSRNNQSRNANSKKYPPKANRNSNLNNKNTKSYNKTSKKQNYYKSTTSRNNRNTAYKNGYYQKPKKSYYN